MPLVGGAPNGGHPLRMWVEGFVSGFRALRREPVLGLKGLILPVSYWRSQEFAYVWRQLGLPRGARVLDLGSPKTLAPVLARRRGYRIVATDILPATVALGDRYARAQSQAGPAVGSVESEVQDGRALTYPDASFDAAYSISVLEHIPNGGDSQAIREVLRVVRPGGLVVATVPFDRRYRETFVQGPVYERAPAGGEPVFYERHYDRPALVERLLPNELAEIVDVSYWGEGAIRGEAILARLGAWRAPLYPWEALLATLLLQRVEPDGPRHPMAAFFTLRRR